MKNKGNAMTMPKKFLLLALIPTALCLAPAQAQLYKWVGPDGKVNYSDKPPPPAVKLLEKKSLSESGDVSNLPYELGLAASQNPVTLYTATSCSPCNDGRDLLKNAGIPFAEKTVRTNEDIEKLRQVGGDAQLPLLLIGGRQLHGYDSTDWKAALGSAGYPAGNRLPKDYRYPAAEPAAPPSAVTRAREEQAAPARKAATPAKPKPVPDSDFRF